MLRAWWCGEAQSWLAWKCATAGRTMAEEVTLVSRGRVALYGIAALASAALVASVFLLWRGGNTTGLGFVAALLPSIVFGFIGLAARYPCRALSLRRSSATRIVATH